MWEKDGQKFSKLRVVGEKMQMLGGRSGGGGGGGGGGQRSSAQSNQSSQSNQSNDYDGDFGGDDYSSAPSMPPESEIPF
jgi:single-strand DNA-binding protein